MLIFFVMLIVGALSINAVTIDIGTNPAIDSFLAFSETCLNNQSTAQEFTIPVTSTLTSISVWSGNSTNTSTAVDMIVSLRDEINQSDLVSVTLTVDEWRLYNTTIGIPMSYDITANESYYIIFYPTECIPVGGTITTFDGGYDDTFPYADGSLWADTGSGWTEYSIYDVVMSVSYDIVVPPAGLTPFNATHTSSSIVGVVIDFSVEFALEILAFASVIALVGLLIWYRKSTGSLL